MDYLVLLLLFVDVFDEVTYPVQVQSYFLSQVGFDFTKVTLNWHLLFLIEPVLSAMPAHDHLSVYVGSKRYVCLLSRNEMSGLYVSSSLTLQKLY